MTPQGLLMIWENRMDSPICDALYEYHLTPEERGLIFDMLTQLNPEAKEK